MLVSFKSIVHTKHPHTHHTPAVSLLVIDPTTVAMLLLLLLWLAGFALLAMRPRSRSLCFTMLRFNSPCDRKHSRESTALMATHAAK